MSGFFSSSQKDIYLLHVSCFYDMPVSFSLQGKGNKDKFIKNFLGQFLIQSILNTITTMSLTQVQINNTGIQLD